jgi:hypothetical protein
MVTERGVHFAHFLRQSAASAAASPYVKVARKKKRQVSKREQLYALY